MTEELEAKVVEMYRAKVPVNKICADLNINMKKLYRILRKHGVPLRSPRPAEREPRLVVEKKREA